MRWGHNRFKEDIYQGLLEKAGRQGLDYARPPGRQKTEDGASTTLGHLEVGVSTPLDDLEVGRQKTEVGGKDSASAQREADSVRAKPNYLRSSSVVEMPEVYTFLNFSASEKLAQKPILPARIPRAQSAKRTRTVQNPTPSNNPPRKNPPLVPPFPKGDKVLGLE
jgi:hypothetical protein